MMKPVANNTSSTFGFDQLRPIDYIKITIFGFALSALWNCMGSIIMPLRVLDFVAESQKNTYLGMVTFVGLALAMVVQPVAGAISDRSGFGWGRRRPYILAGTILSILLLLTLGFAGSYAALFLIYCFLQISSNFGNSYSCSSVC